jgi:cytochrome c-type biogenesis protein CcmE
MKPKAIILIVMLAVAIAAIMSTYSGAEKSSTFTEAAANPGDTYHITGFLAKDMPMEYDPVKDANYFSFYLKDKEGALKKVVSSEPKQQDFERAESVNMYGHMDGEIFVATKVIPKCPSKYKDEETQRAAQAARS